MKKKTKTSRLVFKKLFGGTGVVLFVSMLLMPSASFAATTYAEGMVGSAALPPAGNISCFDYYRFGSVKVDVSPSLPSALPGAPLTFSGKVVNENAYPVTDVMVYVKVFRKQVGESVMVNGHNLVDQFVAEKGISIPGKGERKMTFEWSVPALAEQGEYMLATYVISGERFNLSGLSFTDDVTGTTTSFSIQGNNTTGVGWNKNAVTLNGEQHRFASYIRTFPKDTAVKLEAPLSNSTNQSQEVLVTWKAYNWDGLRESQLLETKTETVSLNVGEKKSLAYFPRTGEGAVTYVVAEANHGGAKSFLDVRFARNDVEQVRINFPSLTSFPVKSGEPMSLFSCFHGVGSEPIENGTLVLTLADEEGSMVATHTYSGRIGSEMMGEKYDFTPQANYNKLTLSARLSVAGKEVEQYTVTYDCEQIDPASCFTEAAGVATAGGWDMKQTVIWVVLGLLLLSGLLIALKKWRSRASVPPGAILFFLALGLSFGTDQAQAKTVGWTSDTYSVGYYDVVVQCTRDPECVMEPQASNRDYLWITTFSVGSVSTTVNYEANVYNNTTGALIPDGGSIPVGTVLRFAPKPFENTDISWFGMGGFNDSPFGKWGVDGSADVFITQVNRGLPIGNVDLYGTLQAPVPGLSYSHGGTAALSCNGSGSLCTVNSPGSISSTVTFAATDAVMYGKFRKYNGGSITQNIWYDAGTHGPSQMRDMAKVSARGCSGNNITSPWDEVGPLTGPAWDCYNDAAAQQFILNIPSRSIPFNFTATATAPCDLGCEGSMQYRTNASSQINDFTAPAGNRLRTENGSWSGGVCSGIFTQNPFTGTFTSLPDASCAVPTINVHF